MNTSELIIKFARDLEEIAGRWNGEDENQYEEDAMMAVDILQVLKDRTDEWGIELDPELAAYNDVMGQRGN